MLMCLTPVSLKDKTEYFGKKIKVLLPLHVHSGEGKVDPF